ncbi:MAG: response regulator [Prolixibacteraceae bacterium]
MNKVVKIGIVEDHVLFREGLRYVLSANHGFEIIMEAGNGREFLEKLELQQPDVVLMDIDMPVMNGIEATALALQKYPGLKIITLSMHSDYGHYKKMIDSGACGFVLKNSGVNQLTEAIFEVVKGNSYFSQELLMNIILKKETPPASAELVRQLEISDREMDVLHHICQGLSNKQIAEKLFISIKTVEGHKSKLMLKTETSNNVSLVLFSIKNQLIEI